ncbi:hypothetical protein [Hyphomonas atlantica]|uniref:hypothetical protein n=1 Tax=Hyphomonas atlantica TaxID=1280948 RepID=UPI0035168D5F
MPEPVDVAYTEQMERVVLYARRAKTPAEAVPLTESRENRNLAYWETGLFAYALTREVETSRILLLSSEMPSLEGKDMTEAT